MLPFFPSTSKSKLQDATEGIAADGSAKFVRRKEEAGETMEFARLKADEAKALNETLQGDGPVYPKIVATLKFFQPCLRAIWNLLCCILPLYGALFRFLYFLYDWAPKKVITMVVGCVLCFFGGTYVVSLAAIEAFIRMGGERLWDDMVYVYDQIKLAGEATLKDEEEVGGLSTLLKEDGTFEASKPAELMQRRAYVVLTTLKEPNRLENAIGSLWSAYVAVLATLSLQFAQVVALALGTAAALKPTVNTFLAPVLSYVIDPSLHHWVSTIINTTLNLLAMSFAWYLMAVVAAVYSGLKGGRMFADALFGLLAEYGLVACIPSETIRSLLEPSTSYADEVIAYSLAAFGIYTQIFSGFDIFFPLDIVLLPLTAIEWFLRYQLTFGSTATTG